MNKYDAARLVMGDKTEGTHVFLWMPGWITELKIYSPWKSYPATRNESAESTCVGISQERQADKR